MPRYVSLSDGSLEFGSPTIIQNFTLRTFFLRILHVSSSLINAGQRSQKNVVITNCEKLDSAGGGGGGVRVERSPMEADVLGSIPSIG